MAALAIVGAAVSVASALAGALGGASSAKKRRRALEDQRISNEAWYQRRMNEDATQRADAQRLLQQTEDAIRNRNKSAAGKQAVMGGTEESLSDTKAANASAMAQTASQIAAAGSDRKDRIEQTYREHDADLRAKQDEMALQQQQQYAQAITGVGSAAGNIMMASGSGKGSNTNKTTKTNV